LFVANQNSSMFSLAHCMVYSFWSCVNK